MILRQRRCSLFTPDAATDPFLLVLMFFFKRQKKKKEKKEKKKKEMRKARIDVKMAKKRGDRKRIFCVCERQQVGFPPSADVDVGIEKKTQLQITKRKHFLYIKI